MKRKNQKETLTIKTICTPYEFAGKSLNEQTDAYLNDTNAIVDIDGLVYYRAVQIDLFTRGNKTSLVVFLDYQINVRIGDYLIDDYDNQYQVTGFPTYRLTLDARWNKAIHGVILSGNIENIGQYFAKIPSQTHNSGE